MVSCSAPGCSTACSCSSERSHSSCWHKCWHSLGYGFVAAYESYGWRPAGCPTPPCSAAAVLSHRFPSGHVSSRPRGCAVFCECLTHLILLCRLLQAPSFRWALSFMASLLSGLQYVMQQHSCSMFSGVGTSSSSRQKSCWQSTAARRQQQQQQVMVVADAMRWQHCICQAELSCGLHGSTCAVIGSGSCELLIVSPIGKLAVELSSR